MDTFILITAILIVAYFLAKSLIRYRIEHKYEYEAMRDYQRNEIESALKDIDEVEQELKNLDRTS